MQIAPQVGDAPRQAAEPGHDQRHGNPSEQPRRGAGQCQRRALDGRQQCVARRGQRLHADEVAEEQQRRADRDREEIRSLGVPGRGHAADQEAAARQHAPVQPAGQQQPEEEQHEHAGDRATRGQPQAGTLAGLTAAAPGRAAAPAAASSPARPGHPRRRDPMADRPGPDLAPRPPTHWPGPAPGQTAPARAARRTGTVRAKAGTPPCSLPVPGRAGHGLPDHATPRLPG